MKTNWNLIGLVCTLIAFDSLFIYVIVCIILQVDKLVIGELNDWLILRDMTFMQVLIMDNIAIISMTAMLVLWTYGNVGAIKDALNDK